SILIAHTSSLGCGSASHHAAPYPELPCLGPGIGAQTKKWASRGPLPSNGEREAPLLGHVGCPELPRVGSARGFRPPPTRGTITPPRYFRDVAQSGSALQWGCRGRGFKS